MNWKSRVWTITLGAILAVGLTAMPLGVAQAAPELLFVEVYDQGANGPVTNFYAAFGAKYTVSAECPSATTFERWEITGAALADPDTQSDNSFTVGEFDVKLVAICQSKPVPAEVTVFAQGPTGPSSMSTTTIGQEVALDANCEAQNATFIKWDVTGAALKLAANVPDNILIVEQAVVTATAICQPNPIKHRVMIAIEGADDRAQVIEALPGSRVNISATCPSNRPSFHSWTITGAVLEQAAWHNLNSLIVGDSDVQVSGKCVMHNVSLSASAFVAGQELTIDIAGLAPGTQVDFFLHSIPMFLGKAKAGSDGKISLTTTIPCHVTPGAHTVYGQINGMDAGFSVPVTISGSGICQVLADTKFQHRPAAVALGNAPPLAQTGQNALVVVGFALWILAGGLSLIFAGGYARKRA